VIPDVRAIVDAARTVWARRLIDYSRANSLLFFRDLQVGTLDLSAFPEAVDRLLGGDALAVKALTGDRTLDGAKAPRSVHDASAAPETVRSALVALQRKALSNLEEKGLETLHLAIGMATWPASDGGRPYDAPVLLLPARIETRGRGGDDLRLKLTGEPQLNPVLLHVLEESHEVRIDGQAVLGEGGGESESGEWRIDREAVLARVEQAAATVPGFAVKRRAILANFQFAKMAMVEDLKRNGDAIASSAIVAAVAGHAQSRQQLAQAVTDVEPARLDDRPAAEDYLVLDADSTQHRAIVLVGKGHNGVMQGPPGTGKSQTIANVLAQSVAEGRRVLFVAEKRAALDAVIKRLTNEDVALGHLVLDLHGAAVSRKEVMAHLANALDQIRHATPARGVEAVHRDFESRRQQLNEHARRVNAVRPPTALSVIQIIGMLLRVPTVARSPLRLRGDTLAALTHERADDVKRCLVDSAANPTLLLGNDSSPWNDARIETGRHAQDTLDLTAKAALELYPPFERALAQMVEQLGVRPPATLDQVGSLLSLLADVRRLRQRYTADVFEAGPGDLARALTPASGGRARRTLAFLIDAGYRNARSRLLALRVARASSETLRQEALEAEEILKRWSALGGRPAASVDAVSDKELEARFLELGAATRTLEAVIRGGELTGMAVAALAERLRALARDQRTPYLLPAVHAMRARLIDAGLARFLDDLREHSVPSEHWTARFEFVWLHSAFDEALATDPGLASFNGRTHEQVVAEFVRLDRERLRLNAQRVRRLHAERAIAAMNEHFDQADLVRREAAKRARHIPLRELLARAPDVLTRIAPCWVASPLSVSQLLDGGRRHFDVVVFDEASQILQEEAVPALYRAEQVVVAGDRHQLPPTTFFATAIEGQDDGPEDTDDTQGAKAAATAAIGGFESLLDTLGAFLPSWLLEWHYRSEDERLIAFSNSHVYDGRLITFPSARGHQAIEHILVPHDPSVGGQEESASREVDEVVRRVLHHAATRPAESLGVITMGIRHANRVQAALDRALDLRPELTDYFALDREERFFVKNLETVQGDERDAIILSIGYGKSPNGDLPHRFGPLTQDVGYRRLNVAVTRAKRRLCVVSSFSHDEIDLERAGSRGVQLLKAYLHYAASGGARLPDGEQTSLVPLNAFEADVRDALEARGIRTRAQFGASRYRIDLVAVHPVKPGRPVLAIECDGASYHSSATARDRDRLRQAHLQRLGWRFFRIWSTDWFYNREQETERAFAAYEEAVRLADVMDASGGAANAATRPEGDDSAPPATAGPHGRGPRPPIPVRESIEQYTDRELRQVADWVTSDGLLRTDEELIREMFDALPFERLGSRIRDRLTATVRTLLRPRGGG
jgi:very-short-patch-repair endonuclease